MASGAHLVACATEGVGVTTMDHHRLNQLLEAAMDVPTQERIAFAHEACAGDLPLQEQLLLLLGLEEEAALSFPDKQQDEVGQQFGPYLLKELLGTGGMGAVYRAVRNDGTFNQEVAIKLIGSGILLPETMARFQRERQILAAMSHPNIARLLDGGTTTDGRPFLVMEYVEGTLLHHHIQKHQLTLRQRVELFIPICQAVEEAHRHLVVHRDLKPANILITANGVPKLLDFGIARLVEHEDLALTTTSLGPMSPRYASPEQLNGEAITTASDIFSLGTVFFEQLTENHPFNDYLTNLGTLRQAIVNKPAPSLSHNAKMVQKLAYASKLSPAKMRRHLSGDLNTIIGKCLAKTPKDRYPGVSELREDLQRYLTGHPVKARPPTFWYVTRRFLKRNLMTSAATAIACLLLVAFIVVTNVQSQKLQRRGNRLEREYEKSQAVTGFLLDMFRQADPSQSLAKDISVSEILKRGKELAKVSMNDQPETRVLMLNTIAQAYSTLGYLDQAEKLLDEAELFSRRLPKGSLERRQIPVILADVEYWRGNVHEAILLLRQSTSVFSSEDPVFWKAQVHYALARALIENAVYEDVDSHIGKARALLSKLESEPATRLKLELDNLEIQKLYNLGDYPASLAFANKALAKTQRIWPETHPLTSEFYKHLALISFTIGDFESAEKEFKKTLQLNRRFWGENSYYTAESLTMLSQIYLVEGETARAKEVLDQAEKIHLATLGDKHLITAKFYQSMAFLWFKENSETEALTFNQKALSIRQALKGDAHPLTLKSRMMIAQIYTSLNEPAKAEHHLKTAIFHQKQSAKTNEGLAQSYTLYAKLLYETGRFEMAEDQARKSIETYRDYNLNYPNAPLAFFFAGQAAFHQHRYKAASSYLEEGRQLSALRFGEEHYLTIEIGIELAAARLRIGNVEEAERMLYELQPLLEKAGGDRVLTLVMESIKAEIADTQGCRLKAQAYILEVLPAMKAFGFNNPWSALVHRRAAIILSE